MADSDPQPWAFVPFESIGPIRLGMTRDEVIALIGRPRRVMSEQPILEEAHEHARVEYDKAGRLIAYQAYPEQPVMYGELLLTGRPVAELAPLLPAGRWDRLMEALLIRELGLILWAPEEASPPNTVQTVMGTRRDYEQAVDDPDVF